MKRVRINHPGFRIVTLAVLLAAGIVLFALNGSTTLAIGGGQYVLDWYVAGFGGGESAGGEYAMSSTVAQVGADALSGGTYNLGGGFWGGSQRVVGGVTPTPTPTPMDTPTPTETPATPGEPTATVTPTTPGDPAATATPTATPTLPGNPAGGVEVFLPLVDR